MKKTSNVVFRISEDDRKKLDEIIRLEKRPESEYMRDILQENFKLRERQLKIKLK